MLLLIAIHFGVAAFAPLLVRWFGRHTFYALAVIPAATFCWLLGRLPVVVGGDRIVEHWPWIADLGIEMSVAIGPLQWLLGAVASGIGTLVLLYCRWYFAGEVPVRTAAVLLAFAGAMLGLVTSDNLIIVYVFWELTTVFSYLLVGHNPANPANRRAAMTALIVTTFGGLAMLVGILILGNHAGSYQLGTILAAAPSGPAVTAAIVLLLAGAVSKSALVPFHFWLPAAMAAPTPISAYLHAAAMVKAGVYLVALLAPGFAGDPLWRPVLLTLGALTMLVGGWRALRQHDIKLLLAYGTVSQLGFMTAIAGLGTPSAVLAGCAVLAAHALFKSSLFMIVGIVDHQTGTRDLRKLSGVGRQQPVLAIIAILAAASMAGIPPLFGFVAKEGALGALVTITGTDGAGTGLPRAGAILLLAAIVAGSVLTVAYSLRFVWGAFATKRYPSPALRKALHPDPGAVPRPELVEGPHAAARPDPGAVPRPEPVEGPHAVPRPEPGAVARPEPGAVARPEPVEGPHPAPRPEPGAVPRPEPGAVARPEPVEGPHPAPRPEPGAVPRPEPVEGPHPVPGDPIPATPFRQPELGFWLMPAIPAVGGLVLGFVPTSVERLLRPYVRTVPGGVPEKLVLWHGFTPALGLSVLAIALGVGLFSMRRRFAAVQARLAPSVDAESGYAMIMRGLDRIAVEVTALSQRGSLPLYLAVIAAVVVVLPGSVLVRFGPWPHEWNWFDDPAQPVVGVLIIAGAVLAAKARGRIKAVLLAGVTGYGTALLFLLAGAPDLALTQVLVETIILIVLTLVFRKMGLYFSDQPLLASRWVRLMLAVGVGAVAALSGFLAIGNRTAKPVSAAYPRHAVEFGYGKNIVNVTLVDTRAWDTFGEISVLMVAATGVASLIFLSTRNPHLRRPLRAQRSAGHTRTGDDGGRRLTWLRGGQTLSPLSRSIVIEVMTRLLFPVMILVSVYLLLSGHNAPGGGFAAGLITGLALIIRYLAAGPRELTEAAPVDAGRVLGAGLVISVVSAAAPVIFGGRILESYALDLHLGPLSRLPTPWGGVTLLDDIHLVTSTFFDIGVFLVVVGVCLDLARSLGAGIDRQSGDDQQPRRAVPAGGRR